MKLTRLVILTAAACFAAATTTSFAQRGGAGDPQKPNAADSVPNPFHGSVESAMPASVSIKGQASQPGAGGGTRKPQTTGPATTRAVSFVIGPDTKILRDGQPITAAQLKRDESVQVTFTAKKGSSVRHATEIQVGNPPAANAPGARKPGR